MVVFGLVGPPGRVIPAVVGAFRCVRMDVVGVGGVVLVEGGMVGVLMAMARGGWYGVCVCVCVWRVAFLSVCFFFFGV